MKFVYLVKLGLKSALIIVITTSILVFLHGLPEHEYGGQFEPSTGSLVDLPDSLNEIDVQNKGDSFRENGDVWESLHTNSKFAQRYWEFMKDDNRKGVSHSSDASPRIIQKGGGIQNLWRPPFSSFSPDDSNRIIPQIVWGMEPPCSSLSGTKKRKKIVVGVGFKWWGKDWPSGHHQLSQQDCKQTPGIEKRCIFYDSLHNVHDADAVITPRDSVHYSSVEVPSGVLKFNCIVESPYHSWVLLNRSEDLLVTYWRGSDLVTPYAAWA